MNYEEKYRQALENFKKIKVANIDNKKLVNFIECEYPELRESEDERIRKELLEHCLNRRDGKQTCVDASDYRRWAAWLEKPSEKPIEQDTEIHDLWVYIREWNDKFGRLPKDEDELVSCIDYVMKRQKPAEWSEEDKNIIEWLIGYLEYHIMNTAIIEEKKNCLDSVAWLKSLKPNHWKPSKEQMEALVRCLYEDIHQDKELYVKIESLYNDIKTL